MEVIALATSDAFVRHASPAPRLMPHLYTGFAKSPVRTTTVFSRVKRRGGGTKPPAREKRLPRRHPRLGGSLSRSE